MGKPSRDKGKRGELEAAEFIRSHDFEARRGQQFKGTKDSPDLIHNIPYVALEVKRKETLSLYPALEKLQSDSPGLDPVILHRRNDKPWVAIVLAKDWLGDQRELVDLRRQLGWHVV